MNQPRALPTAGRIQKTSAEEDRRIQVLLRANMTQRERHSVTPWVEEMLLSKTGAEILCFLCGLFSLCYFKLDWVASCFCWPENEWLFWATCWATRHRNALNHLQHSQCSSGANETQSFSFMGFPLKDICSSHFCVLSVTWVLCNVPEQPVQLLLSA